MIIKTIKDEDFVNYKVPVMYIGTATCGGKCCIEAGIPLSVCQNDGWRSSSPVEMADSKIIQRYLDNNITKAICFGGLEPFEQFEELLFFVETCRQVFECFDDIVIYTGYYKTEILSQIEQLSRYKNIVIKYGRYIPNKESRYDDVLGVTLSSSNQYAERIS